MSDSIGKSAVGPPQVMPAWQQLLQVLKSPPSAQQKQQVIAILKSDPPLTELLSGVPNRMLNMGNVACWEGSGYAQNPQPHQNPQTPPNPQFCLRQPTQLMGGPNNMSDSIGNSAMGPTQVMPAWQQLLQVLKSPPSAQQKQQVIAILKSDPPLTEMVSGVQNRMLNMGNVACWEGSGYAQNPQPHQNPQTPPNPQFCLRQPTQLMGGPNNMSDSIGNSAMGPTQVMPAWQQLLQVLKSPPSAQQKQQVIAILKSDPPLTELLSEVPNRMLNMGNVACWEGSGYAQNPQPHQNPQTPPNPQFCLRQPTQLMGGPNNMFDSIGNSAMGPTQVMPAWQQLLQVLKSPPSAQQKQQVIAILKSDPPLTELLSGVPNRMLNMGNVACWEGSGYAQNPQPHQNPQTPPNPQFCLRQPTQLMGGPNNMSDSIGNSAMGPTQVMPAWQQLLQVLKSPPSAQQKQQVIAILKSDPPLMAAFVKQRAALQQQQQQQMLLEGIHNLITIKSRL